MSGGIGSGSLTAKYASVSYGVCSETESEAGCGSIPVRAPGLECAVFDVGAVAYAVVRAVLRVSLGTLSRILIVSRCSLSLTLVRRCRLGMFCRCRLSGPVLL